MTARRGPVDPDRLARWLRQRAEMGLPPLFLETLARSEVAERVAATRVETPPGRSPAPSAGAPGPAAVRGGAPSRPGAAPLPTVRGTPPTPSPAAAVAATSAAPDLAAEIATLDHESLVEMIRGCMRCRLHETRTHAVPFDGVLDARVMVVGEAPGAREDEAGRPFVGDAGRLLDLMLASVDLSRERSVYICNVLKCRPPGNRNPQPDEIETCSPYLRRQIELVRPEALLAVGSFAARLLTGSDPRVSLGSLRGTVHDYEGVPLVVTYHPAALLRNRSWTRPAWDDLQLLRTVMEAA